MFQKKNVTYFQPLLGVNGTNNVLSLIVNFGHFHVLLVPSDITFTSMSVLGLVLFILETALNHMKLELNRQMQMTQHLHVIFRFLVN